MNGLLRGSAGAASAMFMVGTLAAVSSVIGGYPLYGGQALRYALAAAILFVIAGARGQRLVVRLTLRESLLLLALAATGLVLFNLCVIEATRRASPALVGTVVGIVPVVLAVVGPLLTRSRPSGRVLAAAAVVVVGASVTTGFGSGNLTGLVYAVGALGCEACFSLLAVPLLPRLGPLRVSAYTEAAAVPLLLVIGSSPTATACSACRPWRRRPRWSTWARSSAPAPSCSGTTRFPGSAPTGRGCSPA